MLKSGGEKYGLVLVGFNCCRRYCIGVPENQNVELH